MLRFVREARERARRLPARLAEWSRARPFPRLVRHFVALIFQGEREGEDEGAGLPLSVLLALLAVPGAFASFFLFDKYSSLLRWLRQTARFDPLAASLPDRYFFIVLSMVITGVVAVLKWDRILPGPRDHLMLGPLPVSPWRIFAANLAAVCAVAGVFAIDVNIVSGWLFPLVVTADEPDGAKFAAFIGGHFAGVVLASAFTFFACAAAMAGLMAALPVDLFRRASPAARSILLGALFWMMTTVAGSATALRAGSPWIESLPPTWFLRDPFGCGAEALAAAMFATAAAALLCYRRYFLRVSTRTTSARRAPSWLWRASAIAARVFRLGPRESAAFRFSLVALPRSDTHSLVLGGFAALAAVCAHRVPEGAALLFVYFLVTGLRVAVELPAQWSANWIYRTAAEPAGIDCLAVVRPMAALLTGALVVVPAAALRWTQSGAAEVALHGVFVACAAALLTEALFLRFRKIPFTCGAPAFRNDGIVVVLLHVLGAAVYGGGLPVIERAMLANPAWFLALPAAGGAARWLLDFYKSEFPGDSLNLAFEDRAPAAVSGLDLLGPR